MLPAHLRLKRRKDFQAVRRQGRHWRDALLGVSTRRNGLLHSRFGFVVSHRIGKAVVRNRVRRRLRAAVYRHLSDLASGYDVVVVAYPPASLFDYHELEAALLKLFQQARLLVEV